MDKSAKTYKNKISKQIFIISIIFFYIPTLIIGGVYISIFRNEELKVNLSIIEKTAKIFETIIYDKNLESLALSKYIAASTDLNKMFMKDDYLSINKLIGDIKKEHDYESVIIYDKECNVIAKSESEISNERLYCYKESNIETYFFYDRIYFDCIVPIFSNNSKTYYIYTRKTLKNNELKSLLIDDINFSIIEKSTGLRVFSTFEKRQEESNRLKSIGRDAKIKTFKDKFFYKYFGFTTNKKLANFLMEVVISPEFYRVRIDKLGYLSITLLLIWALSTFLFFIIINRFLVAPIKKLLYGAENISKGNYKTEMDIFQKNEIGTLAKKFNTMAHSLEQKEAQLRHLNIKLENQVVERTKNLQSALDKLRNYDNQKSDMFYTVIHDIKNPMTVISGYANVMLQYKNFTEEKKADFLKKISGESDRLTNMLNEFLKSLKEENSISQMELTPIDLVPVMEYFYTIYEIQARERLIDFVWNVQTPLPMIMGNKEKMEHVFSNLLSNAFKFVNERGMIKISGRVENNHLKISVSDTGPGIKEGKEKEIFEKFKKFGTETNENKHGSGLGLYIVSQIINKHNGEIWVENNYSGNGCTFYFTIPTMK